MSNVEEVQSENSGVPVSGGEDRLAEPAGTEFKPRLPFPVVGIGASAGGLEAFIDFFRAMRADSGMAFVLIQHLPPERDSMLADILSKHTTMPVSSIDEGMPIEGNHVYVIRPGRTLTIQDGKLHLSEPIAQRGHRHPIDDFFRSLAEEQREKAIAIVLSGMGSNGSAGAESIKAVGGLCIAQEPESAKFASMPQHLLDSGLADFVLKPSEMPELLERYASHPYASGEWNEQHGVSRQPLHEILALLRTRTRHDFTGYKTPTLQRRIERRMGLHQIESGLEYVRYLRQNTAEITALTDDLMIHVTGFFRDPEVWEALERQVVAPMLFSRDGGPIRAWVTACSSGEEAYSLAIVLLEVATRLNREFDIKIFATDTADRSLQMARGGVYPAGIESEISAERLDRFFDKDDATYRVKKEVRELVVFAPQNILLDPPFSRLDICTCRNLLIYMRPETQRRALELLHFGLREGGVLLLGTSETISDGDELFESLDKKNRIFRRIGQTRHGAVEFPLLTTGKHAIADLQMRPQARLSLTTLTNKTLLERYSPPSVVIDRDQHILYFHGHTERYLDQPRGEPTRELLTLARESIRGVLRTAVQQSISQGAEVRLTDGWTKLGDGRRRRTEVSVAPLEERNRHTHFLISFREEHELATDANFPTNQAGDDFREIAGELQRVRDELESTVDELHARNEDLKAAHEEATSINEEMQSTNEELETSKEELQSLNEELVTVNTQLQLKMEELEASSNDLSSLLSSTSIAVVFLDTTFRIRRFTPAVRDLIDLIPADIGRPVRDLARKFDDDRLLADARSVLETLQPREAEVVSESGHVYTRRVLPYRTIDNRIDGVVITFVDITERSRAVRALRESEEQHRLILEGLKEYGIFMLDDHGHVVTWTSGAERVLQFSRAEAIGLHLSTFLPHEGDAFETANAQLRSAIVHGSISEDGWHVRKSGQRFWATGMLAVLKDQHGSVLGFVKVLRDNTDRKIDEETLKQAKLAAETANEAKDRFLANVSHELRTPLSAILMWSSLLLDQQNVPPGQLSSALAAINRSAEEQRELIEDLVDTSRIAAGKLVLDVQNVHLPTVIERGVSSSTKAAADKHVTIEMSIDPAIDGVCVDPARFQQVITNLVSNAVKFSSHGGIVRLQATRNDDYVSVSVSDEGVGIAAEFLPHVYDRFAQARTASSRSSGGLGLGLAIVKHIVELHGGTVNAESDGVAKGATFTVTMHLPPSDAPVVRNDALHKRSIANQLTGINILLVEDVAETRLAIEAVLNEAGARVVSASSGHSAFELYRAHRPQMLLSDIGLPDIDGYQLVSQIRDMEQSLSTTPIPAIALTAFVGQQVRRKAIDAGFHLCLSKPLQPLVLVQAVQSMMVHFKPQQ